MKLISQQAAIDALKELTANGTNKGMVFGEDAVHRIEILPSVQPETCEGCKHLGKWENEVEYGYPSPCTRCKRRVNDNYER